MMNRSRRGIAARALPSVVAAVFTFITSSSSVGNRVMASLGAALLIPAICMLVVLVGCFLFAKVSGDLKDIKAFDYDSPYFLGAVLACTFLWGWAQFSKEEALRRFGECIALEVEQNAPDSIQDAASACRHPEPSDDSNEF